MFFVIRVNYNQAGTQSNSIQKFNDLLSAKKRFYSILAADIDNGDYQYELVQVLDDAGNCIVSQVLDNRGVEISESAE